MKAIQRFAACLLLLLSGIVVSNVDATTAPQRTFQSERPLIRKGFVLDGPVHNGKEIDCELPVRMQVRNKVGIDGAGLCVFASNTMSGEYQNVDVARQLLEYMTQHNGGGWPEKFDKVMEDLSKSLNKPIPKYVQHVGGDEGFLEIALASNRMPAITYTGHDGVFYHGHVAHMVNLVFLDKEEAAILDNNFPGKYLWMSRKDLLDRWKEGGGWAVVWLGAPPAPIPTNMKEISRELDKLKPAPVIELSECEPEVNGFTWVRERWSPYQINLYKDGWMVGAFHTYLLKFKSFDHIMEEFEAGFSDPPIAVPEKYKKGLDDEFAKAAKITTVGNFGIDISRIKKTKLTYSISGKDVSRSTVVSQFDRKESLTLSANSAIKPDYENLVNELPADLQDKFSIQVYDATNWAVADIDFPDGITLQGKTDRKTGCAEVQWRAVKKITAAQLIEALRKRDKNYDPDKDKLLGEPVSPVSPVVPVDPVVPKKTNFILPGVGLGMVALLLFRRIFGG